MQEEKNEVKMEIENCPVESEPPAQIEEKSEKKDENKITEEKPKKKNNKKSPHGKDR